MSAPERDRPAFQVRVAGTALAPLVAAEVVELDISEEVGRHGRLTLVVHNWDADSRSVRYSDDGPFEPGAEIAVSLGHHSRLTTVFEGVIASLTAHFPHGGRPALRVEGRSKSILLEHPPRSRQLADISDAEVAEAVAADYGLSADTADGIVRPCVVSDRTSDWDLLKHRAGELGWVTYVRGDTLVLRPPAPHAQPIRLDYTRDLIELHLTQDLTRAIGSAVGVAWDVSAREATESERSAAAADLDTGRRAPHDVTAEDSGWPSRDERAESPAVAGPDEADARAIAAQRRAALAHYFGSGSVPGNPALRCDGWVSIEGVGTRMSGPHYVTAARHRFSAGRYVTEFQVGSPPALLPPSRTGDRGLALGIVEALDDEGLNRVKVSLPWRADAGDGVWARQATLDAGDGYGTVVVPNEGQEVLVGFVDGDPATPVVLGCLYNGVQQPPFVVDAGTNAVRAMVSPSGHTLHLEDGDSAAVMLVSGKGHGMVLDDKESEVVIGHAGSGNTIRLSGDGIELTAAQGDIKLSSAAGSITLDSLTLKAKASGPSTIETSATFGLKAKGSLALNGALVTIN